MDIPGLEDTRMVGGSRKKQNKTKVNTYMQDKRVIKSLQHYATNKKTY